MKVVRSLKLWLFLATVILAVQPVYSQSSSQTRDSRESGFYWGLEAKVHYRDSDFQRLRVPFPPPDPSNPSQRPFWMETVEPGSHFEASALSLFFEAEWAKNFSARVKVDLYDRYDRNPTSTDRTVDIDEAWLRFGKETLPATLASGLGGYLKFGKMGKFERQDDRHLESYGLVSTAFNRLEDTGLELGIDLGQHFYMKASITQGNPVFMRDPNALAGDNGLDDRPAHEGMGTGILILYDAEVESPDFSGDLEHGLGAGLRFADSAELNGVDVLVWAYNRDLAESSELHGTFYGGDLDLLRGPENKFPYDITRTDKKEVGLNLWIYWQSLSFFGQYVDQELAGLSRTGLEAEVTWSFDLPVFASVRGKQLFSNLAPSVRYSRLDPDFSAPAVTPSPSFSWDWTKIDYGVRVGIIGGLDLTAEFTDNSFVLKSGATVHNDEFLTTLRWRL